MAIPLEATTLVIKLSPLEANFAGGVDGFETIVPNTTFCHDGDIGRVSFMSESDAELFAQELKHYGMQPEIDFAIVKVHVPFSEQAIDWLAFAHYEKAQIVWLAGTEPKSVVAPEGWDPTAEPMTHFSPEEVRERLEFVKEEDGVEVYYDKQTGETVYSARTKSTPMRLFEDAVQLVRPYLSYTELPDGKAEREVDRAIEMLEQSVAVQKAFWNAWWILGKCWQLMGDHREAYKAFKESALRCREENPNPWREYMFECLNLGLASEGVVAAQKAVDIYPEDDGLASNLALAYLIAGRLDDAASQVQRAISMNPMDQITRHLEKQIADVVSGKVPQPKSLHDVDGDRTDRD